MANLPVHGDYKIQSRYPTDQPEKDATTSSSSKYNGHLLNPHDPIISSPPSLDLHTLDTYLSVTGPLSRTRIALEPGCVITNFGDELV